jgi:hypothetical protein
MVFSCKSCVLPAINSQAAKAFGGSAKKGDWVAIRERNGLFASHASAQHYQKD